jgi:tRNA dimethylallyltransferase
MKYKESPLVVIIGTTASGKSELAIKLAQHFDGEIICADSVTVYKGFDIGTAKPSQNMRQTVPHHLLDVADPAVGFNVAEFQRLANKTIKDINYRHKLPFLVGGSGMYVDSVIFGYKFSKPVSLQQRESLNKMDLPELLLEAKRLDLNVDAIDTRNKRRVSRMIETGGFQPNRHAPGYKMLQLGLILPEETLEARIDERIKGMIDNGLIMEVQNMANRYGWEVEPMKSVGYREWHSYFEKTKTLTEIRSEITLDTKNLVKKQLTWFKRNKSIHWLTTEDKFIESVDLITTLLNN